MEYKGAIYHVMARGNRLDKIVRSDEDREVFEKTFAEVIGNDLLSRVSPRMVTF